MAGDRLDGNAGSKQEDVRRTASSEPAARRGHPARTAGPGTAGVPRRQARRSVNSPHDPPHDAPNDTPLYGYLHIGKTGGTSVRYVIEKCREDGYSPPVIFGHAARLPVIVKENPGIRVSFTLRDPIERMISSFNSRMRQSRPTYTAVWKPEEAIAYLWFPTVLDFFRARLSTEERMKSAGIFAEQAMGHVKRGYVYHFHSVKFLKKNLDRIYFVGDIENLRRNFHRYFDPCGIPASLVEQHAGTRHSGLDSTESTLREIDGDLMGALKRFYEKEYEIYDFLMDNRERVSARA